MSLLVFLLAVPLLAQGTKQASTYTYDINGNRVETGRTFVTTGPGGSNVIETLPGANGRAAVEKVEERVVEDGPAGRVVERTIQPYVNGTPGPARKVRIETRGDTVRTSVFQADLNGNLTLAERSTTEKQGDQTTTTIERAGFNGGFALFEKQQTVTTKTAAGVEEQSVAWRPDNNGRLAEITRVLTQRRQSGGQTLENTAVYRPGSGGSLELSEQTSTRAVKKPDGSETRESDVFTVGLPGIANGGGKLQLRERQLVERKAGPGGTLVEVLSVARPSLSDPNRLGGFERVAERVCTGQCQ
jgi:hypothetical protein